MQARQHSQRALDRSLGPLCVFTARALQVARVGLAQHGAGTQRPYPFVVDEVDERGLRDGVVAGPVRKQALGIALCLQIPALFQVVAVSGCVVAPSIHAICL